MKDKKVTKLPLKTRSDGLFLVGPPAIKCGHYGPFVVDQDADKCTCKNCGSVVSPMFVLNRMMSKESMWRSSREAYQEQMARLYKRSRTKCQHCDKITRTSKS